MSERLLAVGVDGARGGWLAALGFGAVSNAEVARVELRLLPSFADLAALRSDDVAVAVDIPMGLLESVDLRPCDAAARTLLKARASTVFAPPSRPLLATASYAEAREAVAQLRQQLPQAKSLSAQAFGIAPKMREADEYLQAYPEAQEWLWECHPELSFRALAEGEVLPDKKSVAGGAERLAWLQDRFPGVLNALRGFGPGRRQAETADALDALVCLDTALRVRADDFEELGGERDSTGLVMRMVF